MMHGHAQSHELVAEQHTSSLMMRKRSSGQTQNTIISVHAPRVEVTPTALVMAKVLEDETSQKIPGSRTLADLKGIKEGMATKGTRHVPQGVVLGTMLTKMVIKRMMTIPENVSDSDRT